MTAFNTHSSPRWYRVQYKAITAFIGLLLCFSLPGQAPFECTGGFYLSLSNGQDNSIFYGLSFDPITSNATFDQISNGDAGAVINAIGYRSTDNFIYGINPSTRNLYRIGSDGLAVFLTTLEGVDLSNRFVAGDTSPDGKELVVLGSRRTSSNVSWDIDLVKIDLESGNYETTVIPLKSVASGGVDPPESRCADIAFDPLTGDLYGYDGLKQRLILIDAATGIYDDEIFPEFANNPDVLGAIFFDAFGDLFAYGRPNGGTIQNTFYTIDKNTGTISPVTTGPSASGNDGCSCPYTVSMNKTVSQSPAFPCDEVIYSFEIVNSSGIVLTDVNFSDFLPDDLTISEIVSNPFGGNIIQGQTTNSLEISNMTLPLGTHTLEVKVEVGEMALGIYPNQALLSNLPPELGGSVLSDNPFTFIPEDVTELEVIPLEVEFAETITEICVGDSVLLDVVFTGLDYQWSDGSSQSTLWVDQAGEYSVTVSSNCDVDIERITIQEVDLQVNLGPDIEIDLGATFDLSPYVSTTDSLAYSWEIIGPNDQQFCENCEEQIARRPFFDETYIVKVLLPSGCMATDTLQVKILKDRSIYIPNAFSPNFDGSNDTFYPFTAQAEKLNSLRIYNRWGALVYEFKNGSTNEASVGWDGRFKGKAVNPGVYLYWMEIEFLDGHRVEEKGDVSVIK